MGICKEANMTINGQPLTNGEAMTLRVAMEALASDLHHDGLGEDETGKAICAGYLNCIESLRRKMGY